MKSILISINPQHAVNILNGSKTLELRKSIPKDIDEIIKQQGGIWVYMYVTKKLPLLAYEIVDYDDSWGYPATDGGYSIQNHIDDFDQIQGDVLNGKVVCRFWFDGYDCYSPMYFQDTVYFQNNGVRKMNYLLTNEHKNALCLEDDDITNYGNGKDLYAWHISKLEILEPMGLGEFYSDWDKMDTDPNGNYVGWYEIGLNTLTKAPQSWQYIWVKEK